MDLSNESLDLSCVLVDLSRKSLDLSRVPVDLSRVPVDLSHVPVDLSRESLDLSRVPVDLSRESMDSFWIVDYKSRMQKICFKSWITNPTNFQKIQPVFTNPMNPHKCLVHKRTINKLESIQILCFRSANPYCIQKISLEDCPTVFKLPVAGIWFVTWLLNDPFHGIKKKNLNARFILICKDLSTNPVALSLIQVKIKNWKNKKIKIITWPLAFNMFTF